MSLWHKRIGGISPTVMEVVTYDYYRMAPVDIGFVGITSNIDFWDNEDFDQALASLAKASDYLAARAVDFIIHFGTPLVVSRGPGYDVEVTRLIEQGTGVRATTSIRSAIDALNHMGAVRRLKSCIPGSSFRSRRSLLVNQPHGRRFRRRRSPSRPFPRS